MAKNKPKADRSPAIRIQGFKPINPLTPLCPHTRGEGVCPKNKKIIVLDKECSCGRIFQVQAIKGKIYRYCEYCGEP